MLKAHRPCVVAFAFAAIVLLSAVARAQTPTIASLAPIGLRPGQTQDVLVMGSGLEGASQFWTNFPCKAVLAPAGKTTPNNGKNPGFVTFRVTLPPETPPGIYAARVAADKGVSNILLLLVDDLPTVVQQNGNVKPAAAQQVSLPAAIDGVIEPLVRRYYKFHVEAGQRVAIEVYARRIGSPLDPTMRLLDASGREVTYCDDFPGLSEDAAIDYSFPKGGDYVVELGDNVYAGGGNYRYRLRLGDFPAAVVAIPPAATRGSHASLRFADISGAAINPLELHVPAQRDLLSASVPAQLGGASARGFAQVLLSDRKQISESEPNDDVKNATRVELGADLNGTLQSPRDVDRFIFAAKAGQSARFTAVSRPLGSPADVVLRLQKADGAQLGSAESTGPSEASLSASFPSNGDYVLEVRDLNRRGGRRFVYHVDVITPGEPGFTLAAAADLLNVPAGGTAIVAVHAKRTGYGGPIALRAVDLPKGVTSVPTVMGIGRDSVELSLRATAAAEKGNVRPIRIVGTARIGSSDFQATATVTDELRTALADLPYPPLAMTNSAALGIGARPPFTLRTEPSQIVFGRGLSAKIKVIVERQKGYDEEIALAVTEEKIKPSPTAPAVPMLPAGITAALKPIPKGATSVDVTFAADRKPLLGEFTAVLVGTLKKGNETLIEPVPGIGLKIDVPFRLSMSSASVKLPRKGTTKLKIAVERNPSFSGPINVTLASLPKGIQATPAKIAAGATETEIGLSAAADAVPGPVKTATVRAVSTGETGRFSARADVPEIVIE